MADDVTGDGAGDLIGGLAVVARDEEMLAGDKVGDEPGELLGDVDVASLAGLAWFLDRPGTRPRSRYAREVRCVGTREDKPVGKVG